MHITLWRLKCMVALLVPYDSALTCCTTDTNFCPSLIWSSCHKFSSRLISSRLEKRKEKRRSILTPIPLISISSQLFDGSTIPWRSTLIMHSSFVAPTRMPDALLMHIALICFHARCNIMCIYFGSRGFDEVLLTKALWYIYVAWCPFKVWHSYGLWIMSFHEYL